MTSSASTTPSSSSSVELIPSKKRRTWEVFTSGDYGRSASYRHYGKRFNGRKLFSNEVCSDPEEIVEAEPDFPVQDDQGPEVPHNTSSSSNFSNESSDTDVSDVCDEISENSWSEDDREDSPVPAVHLSPGSDTSQTSSGDSCILNQSDSGDYSVEFGQQRLFEGSEHSVDEAVLDVVSDYVKNTESQTTLKSHLLTFVKYLPKPNNMPKTLYMLLKYVRSIAPSFVEREHRYCKDCRILFDDDLQFSCNMCSCKEFKKFYSFSIQDQICHHFEHGKLKDILDKRNVTDGERHEKIRDICDGSEYIRIKISGKYTITLLLNTDGVAMTNSSNTELWPILYVICEVPAELRSHYLLVAGVWCDDVKPPMNVFFKPLVEELVDIRNMGGILWRKNGIEFKSEVRAPLICADAPARASLLNAMNHNSRYACNLCEQKSLRIPLTREQELARAQGNKKIKRRRVFLFKEVAAKLRTDGRMREQALQAFMQGKPVKGVKGPTILCKIPSLSLASCVYPEYLHSVCLGAVRQFMYLWFTIPGPWNISQHIGDIDAFLMNIKPPSYVGRLPQGVALMKKWKGSQFRAWLLFYSLVAVRDYLPEDYFQHWMLLVSSTYLLLQSEISDADIQKADAMLRLFVRDTGRLYRQKDYSYNVHCLLHLPLIVRRWSGLWVTSAFQFESFNGLLKKLIHGTKNPAKELTNVLRTALGLEALRNKVCDLLTGTREVSKKQQEVLGRNVDPKTQLSESDKILTRERGLEMCCIYVRARFKRDIFTSILYTRETKRNNYTVCFSAGNGNCVEYGEVKFFMSKNDTDEVLLAVDVLSVKHIDLLFHRASRARVTHMIPVVSAGNTQIIQLANVISKVMRVGSYICLFPNLYERNL